MTDIPRVDELTLSKLIEWTEGYLQRQRDRKMSTTIEEAHRNFALDLWTGIKCALEELHKRRAEKNPLDAFQARVYDWMRNCFRRSDALFPTQRSFRFLEEALELAQASGTTHEEALRLVAYTYNRPAGEVHQEIGGVMVSLAGLATSFGLSIDHAAQTELMRCHDNTEKIRAKDLAKPQRSPLPVEDEQGPMWIPTSQVQSLMRDIKTRTSDKIEIDRKTLEGLLHDSLLWREDRQRAQPPGRNNNELLECLEKIHAMSVPLGTDAGHDGVLTEVTKALELVRAQEKEFPTGNCMHWATCPKPVACNPLHNGPCGLRKLRNRNEAIDAYIIQFPIPDQPIRRISFADGWDACYMQRPQRARAGNFEVGATEDRREVAINAPYTPNNGSGFVHYALTPRQAIGLAETLIRKAADCLPQFARGGRRSSTLIDMALSRATTLRGTHITNPEHDYIVALADEYLAMKGLVNLWGAACTGRFGSQSPCVKYEGEMSNQQAEHLNIATYRFKIEGLTGNGNSWTTEGTVEGDIAHSDIHETAMRASFNALNNGRAVLGTPGAGCRAPYTVTRFLLEKATQ